jgi:hypothetical protein
MDILIQPPRGEDNPLSRWFIEVWKWAKRVADAIPAGSSGQVQVNNAGSLSGASSLTYDTAAGTTHLGTATDYTLIEADGTMVFNGAATVYDDLALPVIARTTGANRPTLALFAGSFINEYTYAIGNWGEVEATELLHGWKEGTPIEVHVHWALNGANDATPRGVKWEVEYTWANMLQNGGQTAFPTAQVLPGETQVAANAPDKTHYYTTVGTITPTGGKIGAYLALSIRRIAATTTPTGPANAPFLLAVGVHYQKDTAGSRSTTGK